MREFYTQANETGLRTRYSDIKWSVTFSGKLKLTSEEPQIPRIPPIQLRNLIGLCNNCAFSIAFYMNFISRIPGCEIPGLLHLSLMTGEKREATDRATILKFRVFPYESASSSQETFSRTYVVQRV
jgi:hypothetical protein